MLFRYLIRPSKRTMIKSCLISNFENHFGRAQWLRVFAKSMISNVTYSSPSGSPGSGAGKGGGAGGSVRESGGGLGQFGAAQEEQFFFNKQREQLEKIKKKLKEEKSGDLTRKEEK